MSTSVLARKLAPRVCAALMVATSIGCTVSWETVGSEDGRFSVEMPRPRESRETVQTPYGRTEFRSWSGSAPRDVTFNTYSLRYAELPMPPGENPQHALAKMRDWVAAGFAGSVSNEAAISIDGAAGSAFNLRSTKLERAFFRVRLYMIGPRFVQLMVGHTQDESRRRSYGDRFFDSFKVRPVSMSRQAP